MNVLLRHAALDPRAGDLRDVHPVLGRDLANERGGPGLDSLLQILLYLVLKT